MTRKTITILLLVFMALVPGRIRADEVLKRMIVTGSWQQLPALFLDGSHAVLQGNFSGCKSIEMIPFGSDQWFYQAKFAGQGEIGVLTFAKRQGKYFDLKLMNQVKPLYFIEKFRKYRAVDVQAAVGPARVHFKEGTFYESAPYRSLLLFLGEWEFTITPDDEEEKLTLERRFGQDYFSHSSDRGIFILEQKDFLDGLPVLGESENLAEELRPLFQMYRDSYGIHISHLGEYWYAPFSGELNLVVFKKDENSSYYYSFNEGLLPDTQLSASSDDSHRLILSYNARQGLKATLGGAGRVSHVDMTLDLNPYRNLISGSTTISYQDAGSLRELDLGEGIDLKDGRGPGASDVNVFRRREKCYVLAPYGQTLSLSFSGKVKPVVREFELFRSLEGVFTGMDRDSGVSFYFLSKIQDYYPNPGDSFFKADVTVNLPVGLNCLAPGSLVEKRIKNAATFKYASPGTRGISLVVGAFKRTKKVAAQIPINFYTYKSFKYPRKFDFREIKDAADFFLRTFGPLDLEAINILIKSSWLEGGISNNGFIVVHLLPEKTKKDFFKRVRRSGLKTIEKKSLPPSLIRNRSEDCILHELAHQWWGGLISGQSYQDAWLTEGLAHFSVLYYLKKKLPERRFNRIVKKMKKWVYRHSDCGPIIYGTRIHQLEDSYEAYQSIVYNKSAVVLLMLMDLLGEDDFMARLRSVLEKYKYQAISTMQFIRCFAGDNKMVSDFFRKWLYSRKIPAIQLELAKDDPEYDHKNLRTIVLNIKQTNTDFIFPLQLSVLTLKGQSLEHTVITQKEQRVVIARDAAIQSIHTADATAPIREK